MKKPVDQKQPHLASAHGNSQSQNLHKRELLPLELFLVSASRGV